MEYIIFFDNEAENKI